jgi:urea transport system substrate-binding protein
MLRRLREAGVRATETPTVLFSVSEDELRAMPRDDISGNYAVSSHFRGDRGPQAAGLGREAPGGGPIDSEEAFSAYQAVRMWAGAVAAAGSADVVDVRSAIRRQSLATSEGVIAVDPQSLHAWRGFSVGRIRPDGSVEVERLTEGPTRPAPFPATRSRAEWTRFQSGTPRDRLPQRSSPTTDAEMGVAP